MFQQEFLKIIRRRSYGIIFGLLLLAAFGSFLYACQFWYGADKTTVYAAKQHFVLGGMEPFVLNTVFSSLLPIVVSIAVSDVYDIERENGTTNLVFTRISKRKNIRLKARAVCVAAFLLILVPLVLNAVLCLLTFPCFGVRLDSPVYMKLIWGERQQSWVKWSVFQPYLVAGLLIFGRCLIGMCFGLFSFSVSVLKQGNRYFNLLSAFVLSILYSAINALLPFSWNDIYATNIQNSGAEIGVFLLVVFVISVFFLEIGGRREEVA